jgi:hypothetical protein
MVVRGPYCYEGSGFSVLGLRYSCCSQFGDEGLIIGRGALAGELNVVNSEVRLIGLTPAQARMALNASQRLSSNHYQKEEGEPACSLRLKDLKSTALAACPT